MASMVTLNMIENEYNGTNEVVLDMIVFSDNEIRNRIGDLLTNFGYENFGSDDSLFCKAPAFIETEKQLLTDSFEADGLLIDIEGIRVSVFDPVKV